VSYLVFARKYRPKQFDEVVGQEHVAHTLQNAIAADRLAHAYLLCGPRGVGKTTMARLLAKAVNCPDESADPAMAAAILQGRSRTSSRSSTRRATCLSARRTRSSSWTRRICSRATRGTRF
jgi:replication-associated recombination protein RarA